MGSAGKALTIYNQTMLYTCQKACAFKTIKFSRPVYSHTTILVGTTTFSHARFITWLTMQYNIIHLFKGKLEIIGTDHSLHSWLLMEHSDAPKGQRNVHTVTV